MKNKIGQIVTITKDYDIETSIGGEKINVKKGDQGFVDSSGNLHYIKGKARGKIQAIEGFEADGYDNSSIANLVYLRLLNRFGLSEIFDDYDIDSEDFMNEIEDVLDDIL